MKRAVVERNIVVVLFVAVLVIFSFAQRDSKKLSRLYSSVIKHSAQQNMSRVAPAPAVYP
jgi:flagellar biosynthesis protein FlhB